MKRPDLKKLVQWAMSQRITPNEKVVLVDMCLRCDSPFLQIPYSQRQTEVDHGIARTSVKRAVKRLADLELIESRGRKPMDEHRYVNMWQLCPDERVESYPQGATEDPTPSEEGTTEDPTNGDHPGPHSATYPQEGAIMDPSCYESKQSYPQVGATEDPLYIYTNTNSLQYINRGATEDPTPEKEGAIQDPTPPNGESHPTLANLPPNVKPGVVRLIQLYPPIDGEQSFAQADGEYRERRREGHTDGQMIEGIKRYRAFLEAKGQPPKFTMHLKKFIGPDKHFLKPWAVVQKAPVRRRKSKLERAEAAYREAGYVK